MKRYDNLKQYISAAMHTLRVGSFSLDSAFDVLRIGRRFVMPKIEFAIVAKSFDDPDGLNWHDKIKLIFFDPMRIGYERTSSYYLTPEIADLKLDGKPLPDDFVLTDRRIEAIFPRLEFSAFNLYAAIEREQVTLQQALDAIGDRAVYELKFHEYMTYLCNLADEDKHWFREQHKACVDVALTCGRKVPDSVLRDHYDLGRVKVQVPPKMAQASLFDVLRLN